MSDLSDRHTTYITFTNVDVTACGGIPPSYVSVDHLARHRLLRASVDKLKWAERHLAALKRNIDEMTLHGPPSHRAVLRADLDVESGYHVYRVAKMPDLSELDLVFTHSISDIANPLRSALDKLAWASAKTVSNPPKDPRGVKFPIAETPDEWVKAGRARNQLDPSHCGFIESFQPYHGLNGRADDWSGPYIH